MELPPLIRPQVVAQPTLYTGNWFLQLRWFAVVGQLLTMAVVIWGLAISLPVLGLLSLIGVTAITNILYGVWLSHLYRRGLQSEDRLPTDLIVSALMLMDVAVLTGMLYVSGGMANPFSLFYFVNIAVAAAILSSTWAWGVWLSTVAGMTLLLFTTVPLAELDNTSLQPASPKLEPSRHAGDPTTIAALQSPPNRSVGAEDVRPRPDRREDSIGSFGKIWTVPKLGLFVSFATCSGVITYFITVLTGELRQREEALKEAEDARVRNRQLEGLATLAAGAAHELATPLTTIAVVAKELSRSLDKENAKKSTQEDVKLIRSELDQCRVILDRMTSAAGDAAGERLQNVTLAEFIEETMVGIRQPHRVERSLHDAADPYRNLLPVQATAQALRNLLQNAMDASTPDKTVVLDARTTSEEWLIEIRDQGEGMSAEVLERIGEPFFTTKEPGRGMGLGLYLTENVVRGLGGQLEYESEPGAGTVARLRLPTSR